ncbi:hypothetical protein F2Q68_00003400 [Brassica cretica]|uniref:DUF4283 domain-containing protein n=1 Tax=Brassica cretica TaxID=69181 RepID=A0A8S9J8V8_BRACR|nr:hypothetical protein F2Q68_00003400 [Brassica cretica]
MFHTAQWSSEHSMSTPPLKAIKIWAHLTGVPLDLRHQEGLSLVASLVGDPKETDDFTRNLVNLTLSHVKVEVDLTQPLPSVVEFQRQSGEVVEVLVHYPWIPPTCSHCHELDHLVRNCLLLPPPSVQNTPKQNHPQSNSPQSNLPIQNPFQTNHPKQAPANSFSTLISKSTPKNAPTRTYDQMVIDPPLLTALPTESSSDHVNPPLSAISFNSPDPIPRRSLKRSRSSPTFTPSSSLNPNPFVHQPTDPVEALTFLSNPLTPISSTRPPIENPNSSLDFLHLVPRLTSEVPPSSSQ